MLIEENKEYKKKPARELLDIAQKNAVYPKVYALISLILNHHKNKYIFQEVIKIIKNNMATPFMGNIKISWIGIIVMLESNDDELKYTANMIIDHMESQDKDDLIWYLEAENILRN